MANQIKLTKEIIERFVNEELDNLDEGKLQQILAKTRGSASGMAAMIKNIGALGQGVTKGKIGDLLDPAVQKSLAVAASRVTSFATTLDKVTEDFMGDMEALFGENVSGAPEDLKAKLEAFVTDMSDAKIQALEIANDLKSGNVEGDEGVTVSSDPFKRGGKASPGEVGGGGFGGRADSFLSGMQQGVG